MTMPAPPQDSQNLNVNPSTTHTTLPQPVTVINQPPQGQYFTAEQLEAARQQEKDKLYGRMQALETQFNDSKAELDKYRQEREAAESARLDAEKKAADAKKAEEESKLSVQDLIKRKEQEWQEAQNSLQNQLEMQKALMDKDRELFRLQQYIQRRVAEEIAENNIIPDLAEYIDGNNEEQVEASITKAKEKTASIVAGALGQNAPRTTPGVSPTGFAPTGPLDNLQGTQSYQPSDIQKMSLAEYAEFRAKAGIDKAGNNKGLFG